MRRSKGQAIGEFVLFFSLIKKKNILKVSGIIFFLVKLVK